MIRKEKPHDETKEYFEKADKGRKKPWQSKSRTDKPNRTRAPRGEYKRVKFDWRELIGGNSNWDG